MVKVKKSPNIPAYKVDHLPQLEQFNFSNCANEEVIFFQVFNNPSYPDTFKIYFNREDSRNIVNPINSSTGTATPWKSFFECIFIGKQDWVDKIYTKLLPYDQGLDTYYIEEAKIDELINKQKIVSEYNSPKNLINGLSGIIYLENQSFRQDTKVGFVYCMVNPRSKKQCKIGMTVRDPRIRAAELSIDTGLPDSFKPIFFLITQNPLDLEKLIHEKLDEININKEHFSIDTDKILSEVLKALSDELNEIIGLYIYQANWSFFSKDNCINQIAQIVDSMQGKLIQQDKENELHKKQESYLNGFRKVLAKKIGNPKKSLIEHKIYDLEEERSQLISSMYSHSPKTGIPSDADIEAKRIKVLDIEQEKIRLKAQINELPDAPLISESETLLSFDGEIFSISEETISKNCIGIIIDLYNSQPDSKADLKECIGSILMLHVVRYPFKYSTYKFLDKNFCYEFIFPQVFAFSKDRQYDFSPYSKDNLKFDSLGFNGKKKLLDYIHEILTVTLGKKDIPCYGFNFS